MTTSRHPRVDDHRTLLDGVLNQDRRALAKAITLIESSRREDADRAGKLLDALLPHTGGSIRVGVSGTPGVGKSTFIEALGLYLTGSGKRLAVLAVDPSSELTGGSIMGDKTRMERLSQNRNAFIRPTPSGGTLGGVAARTREVMLLCEAAGFDVTLVETVGVGQSETMVAGMVDLFALLQQPHAGDDLQGIKRGVMELVDILLIHKADTDPAAAARARAQFEAALHLLRPQSSHWSPRVLTGSGLQGEGIEDFWNTVLKFHDTMTRAGELQAKRRRQNVAWLWSLIDDGLRRRFETNRRVRECLPGVIDAVTSGSMVPNQAARRLLDALDP